MAMGEGLLPRPVPEPTLRRLPLYLRFLQRLMAEGVERISCPIIAAEFKLDHTQVRKDLAATGIVGKAKIGYPVESLVNSIETFLGWNDTATAFLMGVGSLGTALLGYERFGRNGIEIAAAFDVNPDKVGQRVHGREVMHAEKLPNLALRMHVHIGILTVPPTAAQAAAELMLSGGIRAIWNFSPAVLRVPQGIIVENVDLSSSLAVLCRRLRDVLTQPSDDIQPPVGGQKEKQ